MTKEEKLELFRLRRAKKITLGEIAKSIGCSISLLSQFEREEANISDDKWFKYKEYILNTVKYKVVKVKVE